MTDKPVTESEVDTTDAEFWLCELGAAKGRMESWYAKAEEAEDRYRDCEARPFGMLNIFWANVETQKAAIGEDFGKPQVTRVNQPENDGGLSRHVANIWERAIAAGVRDTGDNHDISLAVGDTFLPGRGQIWLELEADEDEQGKVVWAKAPLVRVPYKDYLEGYATRWGGVPWVARRHLFTRDDLIKVCDMEPEAADNVPLNVQLPDDRRKDKPNKAKGKEQFKRAAVWEIWTKYPLKGRIYVAEDHKEILCADPDPYRLKHFFPCPRPLLANGDEGWQEPLTDYSRYEDQAKELDQICARIFVLTAVLRRRGIHDKQFKELADLAEADDNVSLAVDNWADLQQRGGLNKVVEWEDLAPTIGVLVELHKQRRELIELIYELSGISDLARGMTDPRETLGAQQLKMSFGAGRFKRRETESRRFAAEGYQIKGEVIAEHFPREQLQEMSGIPLPTQREINDAKRQLGQIQAIQQQALAAKQKLAQLQQAVQSGQVQLPLPPEAEQQARQLQAQAQTPPPDEEQLRYLKSIAETRFSWERVSGVLRSDYRRCYSVEVETDQTNFIDEEGDKKARTEFFQAVMQVITQIMPMIAGNPKNGEVFKQLIMFVISAFRSGRSVEEGLERAIDEAIQMAQQNQGQQQQDPKAQADAAAAQAKVQTAQIGLQTAQVRLQTEQVKAQQAGADIQAKAAEAQFKGQEAQIKAAEGQQKVIQGEQKVRQQEQANAAKRQGQVIDNVNKVEQLQFERAQRATARETYLQDRAQPARPPA